MGDETARVGSMSETLRRAESLHAQGKLKEAIPLYQDALDEDPYDAERWYSCGIALLAMRDYKGAIKFLESALQFDPDSVTAWYNLGIASDASGFYEQAEECYRAALKYDPDSILPHVTLGGMLYRLGRPEEGYGHHSKAIARPIVSREDGAGRAHIHLLRGNYRQGWREYESRLTVPEFMAQHPTPEFGRPWRGQKLRADRKLLLWHEQGMGDTLMMLRYVPYIATLGSPIVLMVQPLLKRLVEAQNYPVELVIVRGEPYPHCYYHCPLMSIPWALRDHTVGLKPFWPGNYIAAPTDTGIPQLEAA